MDIGNPIPKQGSAHEMYRDDTGETFYIALHEEGVRVSIGNRHTGQRTSIDIPQGFMRAVIDWFDELLPQRNPLEAEAERQLIADAADLVTALERDRLEDRDEDAPVIEKMEEQFEDKNPQSA